MSDKPDETRHAYSCQCPELQAEVDALKAENERLRRVAWSVVQSMSLGHYRSVLYPRRPLWGRVGQICGLGSTSAMALCRECGRDPDTGKQLTTQAEAAQAAKDGSAT